MRSVFLLPVIAVAKGLNDKRYNVPQYVIPSEHSEPRNLPKWQVLSCGGSFTNVVDSSTPLRCGRNDNAGTLLRIRPLFLQHFTPPCRPSSGSPRRASFPQGKLLYRAFGALVFRYGVKVCTRPSPSGKGDRHRRWMRCGTAFNIVGTTGAEVEHIEKPTLALPLGELSPQVTERAMQLFLNDYVH